MATFADDWQAVAAAIATATGGPFSVASADPLGGGNFSSTCRLSDGRQTFFAKRAQPGALEMFRAEAEGLAALADSHTLRVPAVISCGSDNRHSWLVTEYIEMHGSTAGAQLGEQLAALHRSTAECFGWHRDNTIGSTPQHNAWHQDWVTFLRERRLGFQLRLASENGAGKSLARKGEQLLRRLSTFFSAYQPQPSLLHGDLWGGNWSTDCHRQPVIFDPAVYYGDRETDLAMTELFGGFGADFYQAYKLAWPLDPGYPRRRPLYQLYHVLNHFNLFGAGYGAQAESLLDGLLRNC